MALLKRRFGAHLSDAAKGTLAGRRPYPSLAAIRNPLTRQIARRIAESDWLQTFDQLDFTFEFEDCQIGGVPCVAYRTERTTANAPLIFYIHAGGFVCGSPRVNATAVLPTCHLTGCEAVAVKYSLAPEILFPTQLIEIETVYRTILTRRRSPSEIFVIGDSAGGSLALSSLYRWKRLGLPLPAGIALLSPLLDARAESDTHHALKGRDPLFLANGAGNCAQLFQLYAGDADCADPEISPIVGDPSGMPPALLHVGTREVLLGDSARFSEKARLAGVDVTLRVFDGMFHLFHQHWSLPEAKAAHRDIADFVMKATRQDGLATGAH